MVGSSFAYFTDVESSINNTFTAGTFNMQIADTDEWFGSAVSQTWTMSNMVPGVTTAGPFSVNLHNTGSIAPDHVEISFSYILDTAGHPAQLGPVQVSTPGEMARWIEITSMTYDTINFVPSHIDANGNGFFDLEDVILAPYTSDGGPFDNLPPPMGAGIRSFTMALKLNSGAPNSIQGDILTATVTFTLNQNHSQ